MQNREFTLLLIKPILVCGLAALGTWALLQWLEPPRHSNLLTSPSVTEIQRYDEKRQAKLTKIWTRIENRLNIIAPKIAAGLGPPASSQDIERLEQQLGYTLPGELKASLLIHGLGHRDFVGGYLLYGPANIYSNWEMYLETDAGGYASTPLEPDEGYDGFWHPGWLPVAGCNAFEMVINLETGEVFNYQDPGVTWTAESWSVWLETIAERLETEDAPDGYGSVIEWVNDAFPNPGAKKTWDELIKDEQ
jgi:cell wall assembly regulator SMI1